jgi:hypothetical protein
VIDATEVLTAAGEEALLPVWKGTGFTNDVASLSVPGRRLYLAPTALL